MVYDIVYLVRLEFVKDRNDDCSVGYGSKECYTPMRHVTSTEGNLIAFLYTTFFEDDVELFNLTGYIFILVGHALVVCQGVEIPILLDTLLN